MSPWPQGLLYISHRGFILESINLHLSALQGQTKSQLIQRYWEILPGGVLTQERIPSFYTVAVYYELFF